MYKSKNIVLYICNSKSKREAIIKLLEDCDDSFDYVITEQIDDAEKMTAKFNIDTILSDYMLLDGTAFDLINKDWDIPIIFLADPAEEDFVIRLLEMGAYDYVIRDDNKNHHLKVLPVIIKKAISYNNYKTESLQKERQFRDQYKNFPIPTYTWKKTKEDFVLSDYNKKAHQTTQGNIEKFIGKKLSEMYKDQPEIIRDIETCYANERNIRKEIQYHMKTIDRRLDLMVDYVFVHPDMVMVHTKDITVKNLYQQALEDSEKRFKDIATNIADWIWEIDSENIFTYTSKNVQKMLGYNPEELLGMSIFGVLANHESESNEKILKYFIEKEEAFKNLDMWFKGKNNEYVYLLSNAVPLTDDSGKHRGYRGISKDITRQKRIENLIKDERDKAQLYLDVAQVMLLALDGNGNITMINRKGCEILGYESDKKILGKNWIHEFIPEWKRDEVIGIFKEGMNGHIEKIEYLENYVITKTGKIKLIAWHNSLIYGDNNTIKGSLSSGQDITKERRATERLKLLSKVFECSNDAIAITDYGANIIEVNRSFTEITGYNNEEIIGQNMRIMKSGKHDRLFYKHMWETLLEDGQWTGEVWDRRKNGEIYPKWLSIGSIKDNEGNVKYFVSIFSDITQIKQAEERLRFLAHYDMLTGLPNRLLFQDRLVNHIEHAKRYNRMVAVMFLDLDGFKLINDTLGHRAGDKLLVKVGDILRDCIRSSDTAARLGGDEFTIIMLDIASSQSATIVAKRILKKLSAPIRIDDKNEVYVTASIGIAIYPYDGDSAEELIKNSDTAMYHAKENGKNNYQFFSEGMNKRVKQRLRMETQLRRSVENEDFLIYYQPQVNAKSNKIFGLEALIRWQHPEQGIVEPLSFIPIAEETGLIIPIGEWVITSVCKQLKIWQDKGFNNITVTVNVSGKQFRHYDIMNFIREVIKENNVERGSLVLEITETDFMQDIERTKNILVELSKLGIKISIDDFGTGYSSLGYLKGFSVDSLKIDRTFISDVLSNKNTAAITKAIINLAKNLELDIIAEGVETKEQLDFLTKNGCDNIQGYYYNKPMPIKEIEVILSKTDSNANYPTN